MSIVVDIAALWVATAIPLALVTGRYLRGLDKRATTRQEA